MTAFLSESKQYGLDTKNKMAWRDGFWMDQYLVTNRDFECMIPGHRNERDEYSDQDDQPVIYVNWWEAALYCRWRGAGFHLPTDHEWHTAASWDKAAQGNRKYPWEGAWGSDQGQYFGGRAWAHDAGGNVSGGCERLWVFRHGGECLGVDIGQERGGRGLVR